MPATYSTMLQFTMDGLIEVYGKRYINLKGERKMREVFQKVEFSPNTNKYIQFLLENSRKPIPKELQLLMNSITYFIFSKPETLCMGGLATIALWRMRADPDNEIYSEEEVAKVCADFIIDISKTKFNIKENFFSTFFKEIDSIGRNENLQNEGAKDAMWW